MWSLGDGSNDSPQQIPWHQWCHKPTEPGTWVPRLRLVHPPFLFLSHYLERRVKQVQRLLIDHTFVLFSYNRSIPGASKHFCRALCSCTNALLPPPPHVSTENSYTPVRHAGCVMDSLCGSNPQGSGGVSEIKTKTLESVKHFPGHVVRIVQETLATLDHHWNVPFIARFETHGTQSSN